MYQIFCEIIRKRRESSLEDLEQEDILHMLMSTTYK